MNDWTSMWDRRFMGLAKEARSWTKGLGAGVDFGVGACVVSPDKRQFSLGYAGFPRGIADSVQRLGDKEYRDFHTVHAELNAILNAGTSLVGWSMYATSCPCAQCSNAIIQAGIARVIAPAADRNSSWFRSQLEGSDTLREAGVSIQRMSFDAVDRALKGT